MSEFKIDKNTIYAIQGSVLDTIKKDILLTQYIDRIAVNFTPDEVPHLIIQYWDINVSENRMELTRKIY